MTTVLENLLDKARKQNQKNEEEKAKEKPKRSYTEIGSMKFSEDEEFKIKEEDSYLLRFLKKVLIEGGFTYNDFLGQEKIIYSTFYNMKSSGKVSFETFDKFMRVAGVEYELVITNGEEE